MPIPPLPDAERLYAQLRDAVAEGLGASRAQGGPVALIGVHTGGAWIAERLARDLDLRDLGFLDISFYRDDFSRIGLNPQVRPTAIPFSLDDRVVLLVDDVLHTGRTVRAAMNALFDYGRPARIALAVLVDRHCDTVPDTRELPIAPTYAGARIDVAADAHLKLARSANGAFALTREDA